jgi:hypothetical protein
MISSTVLPSVVEGGAAGFFTGAGAGVGVSLAGAIPGFSRVGAPVCFGGVS